MKSKSKAVIPAALALFSAVFFLTYFAARGMGGGSSGPKTPAALSTERSSEPPTAAPPPGADSVTDAADAIHAYETLGRIVSLPSKDGKRPLELHHEEIPHFLGRDGARVGMKEMIMPFHDLAPDVSLEGFKAGDAVRFTFEVRWNKPPRTLVTRLTPLEPGVTLNLSDIVEEK